MQCHRLLTVDHNGYRVAYATKVAVFSDENKFILIIIHRLTAQLINFKNNWLLFVFYPL